MFINDKAWNLKRAKENYDWIEWHMKRAAEAARKNDSRTTNDHMDCTKLYKAKSNEYMDAPRRSIK